MNDRTKKLLTDMLFAINSINEFTAKTTFEEYSNNKMMRFAVERNLEIIGEAMNKILMVNSEIKITNSRRIVDARNKIIHGYDEIEDINIWAIICNHLPLLKKEVEKLLR